MNIRNIAFAGLLALVAGCADEPVSHHGTDQKVYNFEAAVDAATTVIRRHYTKIESSNGGDTDRVIKSGWQEKMEMNERERWQATATITKLDETNANIDVVVMRQNDESDTGYGERSPSNPKWSLATHYQDEERKLIKEIEYELEKAQREKR